MEDKFKNISMIELVNELESRTHQVAKAQGIFVKSIEIFHEGNKPLVIHGKDEQSWTFYPENTLIRV